MQFALAGRLVLSAGVGDPGGAAMSEKSSRAARRLTGTEMSKRLAGATALSLLVGGPSHAMSASESGDFGDSFASRTTLPIGTNAVSGSIGCSSSESGGGSESSGGGCDPADFIRFQSLVPSSAFSLTVSFADGSSQLDILDGFGAALCAPVASESSGGSESSGCSVTPQGPGPLGGASYLVSGLIPATGDLTVGLTNGSSSSSAYQLTFIPEPSTGLLTGLGLAAYGWLKHRTRRAGS